MTDLNSPRDFVQSGWDYFRGLNNTWLALTRDAVRNIDNFAVSPENFNIQIEGDIGSGTFVRPTLNLSNDVGEISVAVPTRFRVDPIQLGTLPNFPNEPDFGTLNYHAPLKPNVTLPNAPTDTDVVLDTITVPDAPTYTLPTAPTLFDLDLPPTPNITFEAFTALEPGLNIQIPESVLNWQGTAYSSDLLTVTKDRLQAMIAGGLGLPEAVQARIYDVGRSRAEKASVKRVQEVADSMGDRGLYEGGPYLARRLDEAREQGRAEVAAHNTALTIKTAEWEIESIRFSLTSAIALEQALLQHHLGVQQLELEAAKIGADIAYQFFTAQVTFAQLEVDLYKAKAQVYREQIEAKVAQVEVYKAQIEGQKAIGDINESLLRAYVEEIRSVDVLANLYRTTVEAARVRGELNSQKLEQARLRVQVWSEQVRGYEVAFNGYRAEVEGALGSVRAYEILGGVYAKRCDAVRSRGDFIIAQHSARLAQQRNEFEAYRLELEHARTVLQSQVAAIDARLRAIQANTAIYQAEAGVAAAEAASKDRAAELRLAEAKARAEVALGNVNARIAQLVQVGGLYLRADESSAQIVSNVAAATASGVNFGASYNGSLGFSYGKSAGISYSGGADDYAGVPPSLNI